MDSRRYGPRSVFSIHLHLIRVKKCRKSTPAGAMGPHP
jgi:hypothetical protein